MIIKNALMYDDDGKDYISDVFIGNGEILKIEKDMEMVYEPAMDIEGKRLVSGLIDMNCNISDPGHENREDIRTVSLSACKGGFTSIICTPNTSPIIDEKTVVQYVINKAKKIARINVFPCGSMTIGCEGKEISEIGEMVDAGIVAISDGGKTVMDASLMKNIIKYTQMFDIPIITFCEDANLAKNGVMNEGAMSTLLGLNGINKNAEEIIVIRNILLAKECDVKLHISSVSTASSVELIRNAKKSGIKVTCDTSPCYFTLTEKEVGNYNTLAKLSPPLRTEEDVKAVILGLSDGTIDVITSNHQPDTIESKNVEFDIASIGNSSLETTFLVSYNELVVKKHISFKTLIEKMSTKPAEFLNLKSKGSIKVGKDADLFVLDTDKKTKIDAKEFASKAKYSIFDGYNFDGAVVYTIVSGEVQYIF